MANLPASGDITALASNAAAQVAFEALRDWLSQLPAGPEVQLTISAGTITPATRDQGSIKVETEAAAATDDLANIAQTNIQNGSELLLRAYDASHTVVVKHAAGGAGQILLQYDADFSLDDTDKWLRLKRVGTDWIETHRCWGNDPLAQRQALGFKATADVASAATVDLSTATGNVTRITGTTAVSAWTMNAGQWHMIIADGALPLTYHATTNKLNTGANYTCAAGDRVLLVKDNSGIVQAEVLNSGRFKTIGPVSASGTSVDFTDIPPWVKGIAVLFSGLSTNGTQNIYARIGDSGGFETTGYAGSANNYNGASVTNLAGSFLFVTSNVAAQTLHGSLTLSLMDPATHLWNGVCQTGRSDAAGYYQSAGSKALSAALDRVQIGASGDTFDGGTVTLICWG